MIQWNERYNLGIEVIDSQHQKWVEMMNDLQAVAGSKEKTKPILSVLERMVAYTEFHFSFEERLFKEYGYVEESTHHVLHRDFEKKINLFVNAVNTGSEPMISSILKEMQIWLIEHICIEDKKYVDLFKSKSV